jgi:predicted lipoprotein with Yx(FWY)xxD motif
MPMKIALTSCLLAAALALAAGTALAAPPSAPSGSTLASEPAGRRPLYTYDKDGDGKSACVGPCVESWPPLLADGSAKPSGDWSLINRADGGRQWAFKGKPAYGFYRDVPGAPAGGDNKVPGWRLLK